MSAKNNERKTGNSFYNQTIKIEKIQAENKELELQK